MEFTNSAGSVLGGTSTTVDAVAMRAARLARFDVDRNAAADSNGPVVEQNEFVASSTEVPVRTEGDLQGEASSRAPANVEAVDTELAAVSLGPSQQTQSMLHVPYAGFASLPEGAFLRITAQVDLSSACALVAAGGVAKKTTLPAALKALRCAIDKAKEEHRATTAAIEAERTADRERHAAQQIAMTQALAALAPLRTGRAQERFGEQLQDVFGMLEQGANGASEREAEFEARTAQATAALHMLEITARTHVAAGELHAAAVIA